MSGCRDCWFWLINKMCWFHPYARPTDPCDCCEAWYPIEATLRKVT